MKIRFCYIILHYKNIVETKKAVSSVIRKAGSNDYKIIIIDNGSKNYTYEKLIEIYKQANNIDVISTNKNIGFARGNNFGIKYAKKKYSPLFYIVMNNDVYLITENFNNKIDKIYNDTNFSILGPKIINKDGSTHSNPMRKNMITKKEIKILILKRYIKLLLNLARLEEVKNILMKKIKGENRKEKSTKVSYAENVQLHGSCVIFSKNYLNFFEGFYKGTFLYFEEYFLFANAKRRNLLSVYDSTISVFHNEDMSTETLFDNDYKKNRFVYAAEIDSLKKLLKYV